MIHGDSNDKDKKQKNKDDDDAGSPGVSSNLDMREPFPINILTLRALMSTTVGILCFY